MASNTKNLHPWFEVCHSRPQSKYQVFIFPSAGAPGQYYREWDKDFPEYEFSIVIYPGRASRFGEKCLTTMKEYLQQLTNGLLPFINKPCIFIGHSLGSAISYELARQMIETKNKGNFLKLLIEMGRGPPHLKDPDIPYDEMTDQQVIDHLKQMADAATRPIYDYPDYMKMILPMLRADSKVADGLSEEVPLDIPIIVYGGEKEENVDEAFLTRWKELTNKKDLFRVQMFPGHHHFQAECQTEVLTHLKQDLKRILN
ncbi:hypothetical protein I4U23_022744 [Adineta vaga]|nr:hypothetical protein I4U23_022744 [Adineta vaga]